MSSSPTTSEQRAAPSPPPGQGRGATPADCDRTAEGRFTKGNAGGPGEQPSAAVARSAAPPSRGRQRPPTGNGGNGERRDSRSAERTSGASSRPATPRPPDLPDHIDWEYEQRIMDILFGDDDSPPDT